MVASATVLVTILESVRRERKERCRSERYVEVRSADVQVVSDSECSQRCGVQDILYASSVQRCGDEVTGEAANWLQ